LSIQKRFGTSTVCPAFLHISSNWFLVCHRNRLM
jgi:hypothetical protein